MGGFYVTELEAVDFALGKLLNNCFSVMATDGPAAFVRFLERPANSKIFLVKNDDVQARLKKVAGRGDEPNKPKPDLPLVMFYRQHGITADPNQHIQIAGVTRFIDEETKWNMDAAMQITTMPVTLTYSIVFLAWDRATLEKMALCWWAYAAPLGRRHSRFTVEYVMDGEQFSVGASLNAPREVLTNYEDLAGEDGPRLWGSRTMCEVNTQAVYGRKIEIPDYYRIITDWRLMV